MSGLQILHRRTTLLAGLIAIIGAVSQAGSQVPTKPLPKDTVRKQVSSPRIKIQKDVIPPVTKTSGGEVALPPCAPCDVVPVISAKHDDSIRTDQQMLDANVAALDRASLMDEMRRRIDAAVNAAREKMVADSIANAEAQAIALKRHLARGYYIGIGGGASAPQRDLRNGYTGGWNTTVPFGYDATDNPFGIRTDLSIDHMNGTRIHNLSAQTIAASGDITVWSLNADLKYRISAPGSTRTHVYLLGGAGAHRVTGGVYGTTDPKAGQNLTFGDAKTSFGWNAGAGASLAWGPTELFIESRFFQVTSNLAFHQSGGVGTYSSFTPLVIGLQWF